MAAKHLAGACDTLPHSVRIPHKKWWNQAGGLDDVNTFGAWLASDAATGNFDIHTNQSGVVVRFSDRDTAFAFKMRFG